MTLTPAAFRRRRFGAPVAALGGETMGTSWRLLAVDPPPEAECEVLAVFDRIIAEFSHYARDSRIGRFNDSVVARWQPLSAEALHVLDAARAVAARSDGGFDPAIGLLVDLWGFGPAGPRIDLPAPCAVAEALAVSGLRHIEIDAAALRFRRLAPARLDLSGIAKGHAVDAVADRLRAIGIGDFLIEIGGEFRGEGIKPDGQPWWVELERIEGAATPPLRVALHGLSVATSGDYRRFFEHDGRRYAHSVDPRTGRPIDNEVASVSVLHASAMYADAWATALTVLGEQDGMALAERERLAVQMVVRDGGGFREQLSPALIAMLD
ncbi:FAD:protein FMN transferase [Sphingomonas sp. RS6]